MTTKEEFYDQVIAPKLLAIGKECQDNGLGFSAAVEYEPHSLGRTSCWPKDASFAIRLVDIAIQVHGNVDQLIWALMRHGRENGHSSVCLRILGVPETPEETK